MTDGHILVRRRALLVAIRGTTVCPKVPRPTPRCSILQPSAAEASTFGSMTSTRGPSAAAALAAAVLLTVAACGGAGTVDGSPRASGTPSAPEPTSFDAFDTHDVARLTSRAGPVHFRADVAYQDDLSTPILRSVGVVDWTTSRGMAIERADVGRYAGGASQGLRTVGRIWVTPDGSVEVAVHHGSLGESRRILGDTVSLVGLDSQAGTTTGDVAISRTFRDLLDSQRFGPGTPEKLDGHDAVHFEGTPLDGEHGAVDVWVSDGRLITQLLVHSHLRYNPVIVVVRFSGYGRDLAIEPPPSTT